MSMGFRLLFQRTYKNQVVSKFFQKKIFEKKYLVLIDKWSRVLRAIAN